VYNRGVHAPAPAVPKTLRAAIIGLLLLCAAVNVAVILRNQAAGSLYGDFRIFLTAATMVRHGDGSRLYETSLQEAVQQGLYPQTPPGYGALPFNHPVYEALVFVPLAGLSPVTAYYCWQGLNLLLLVLSGHWLDGSLPTLRQTLHVPSALWLLAMYPVAR